jgi:hypothetical protein
MKHILYLTNCPRRVERMINGSSLSLIKNEFNFNFPIGEQSYMYQVFFSKPSFHFEPNCNINLQKFLTDYVDIPIRNTTKYYRIYQKKYYTVVYLMDKESLFPFTRFST